MQPNPQQPQAIPPVDLGNPLIAEAPAMLTTTVVEVPGGQRLCITFRTPTTTLSLLVRKEDAENWSRQIAAAAKVMSGAGLLIAGSGLPSSNGHSGHAGG